MLVALGLIGGLLAPPDAAAAPPDDPATDVAARQDPEVAVPEPEGAPTDATAAPAEPTTEAASSSGFFAPDVGGDETAPPTDEARPPDAGGDDDVPPMPEVEDITPGVEPTPTEPAQPDPKSTKRGLFDRTRPDPDRKPAGSAGGSFFDPGRLEETGPAGGLIEIRGFIAANFFVATRSNVASRDEAGEFESLSPMPFFDASAASLYVGAPIYADVAYARISLDFLSIPQTQITASQPDIIAQANRRLFVESAAVEVNPFAWAKRAKPWFREGFKLTAGVFIVPFGREDEEHASPANWFISRPRAMTSNRVYPGTWSDVGASLKWKPTFREQSPIRPIEIDVGMINGDPCTQTRFQSSLYEPNVTAPPCTRRRRPGETGGVASDIPEPLPINAGFFGVAPDNNINKAFIARVRTFILPALDIGGSFVIGKHPEAVVPDPGETPAETGQALTWRVGGHIDVNFHEMFASDFPLPMVRGEVVYGIDRAADPSAFAAREVLGGYVQVAQMLFRRKKTRLPGLFLQYRFDHADPDLSLPGVVDGVPLRVDLASFDYRAETTLQGHTVGLRMPVVPRLSLKTEYTFVLEDGGTGNRIANDLFGLEAVVDF